MRKRNRQVSHLYSIRNINVDNVNHLFLNSSNLQLGECGVMASVRDLEKERAKAAFDVTSL